jgi:hypothetical protein
LFFAAFVLAFIPALHGSSPLQLIAAARADAGDAGPWLAEDIRGTVQIRASGQTAGWRPLADATVIAPDSEISTGKDGTAVLANGVDRIRLSPNSHLVLPAPQEAGLLTLIRQKLGRVFFDVGARPDRSFEVEAPFLVVLVKGTEFTVQANFIANSVEVDEGTVAVRTADDGDGPGTLVSAGETASIFGASGDLSVSPSEDGAGSDSSAQGKGGSEPRPPSPVRVPRSGEPGEGGGDGGDGGGNGGGGGSGDGGSGGGDGGDGGGGGPGGGDGGDGGGGGSGGGDGGGGGSGGGGCP